MINVKFSAPLLTEIVEVTNTSFILLIFFNKNVKI